MSFDQAGDWLLLLFAGLLVGAAVQDATKLRISNWISVSVLLVCIAAVAIAGEDDWWQHALAFAIVLGIGIPLFAWRWMGGGDVKLFAASAAAFDLSGLLRFIPSVLILGGLLALILIVSRFLGPKRSGRKEAKSVAYGMAIAIGAIATAYFSPMHSAFG